MKTITFTDTQAQDYLDGKIKESKSIFGNKVHGVINDRLIHNIRKFDKSFKYGEVSSNDLQKHGLTHRVYITKTGLKQRNILEDKDKKQVGDVLDISYELNGDEVSLSYDLHSEVTMEKKQIKPTSIFDRFKSKI